MKVTAENFPTIHRAFQFIDQDNGKNGLRHVPTHYQPSLRAVEVQLAKLSDEQLDTFCTGEHDDMIALRDQFEISLAHNFLADYFNDWEQDNEF